MEKRLKQYVDSLIERYPVLKECEGSIIDAYNVLEECFATGHKLLIAGNGGSNADSEHIVGELMKSFKLPRKCPKDFAGELKRIDPVLGKELAEKLKN